MSLCVEGALDRERCLWTAPVFDQVFTGWEECKTALNNENLFNLSRMTAQIPGAGNILFRSLDKPQSARSKTADKIVVDESGDVEENAYYEVLRPMLLDTGGTFWGIGTPRGKNWFWRECMRAKELMEHEGTDSEYAFWSSPTLGCQIIDGKLVRVPHPLENPDIKFEALLREFLDIPERKFRQEYLAEFIDDAGGVFQRIAEAIRKGSTIPDSFEEYSPRHSYQIGVDMARVHDYTVISVHQKDNLRQVYWERFNQTSWRLIYDRVAAIADRYHGQVVLDATGAAGDTQTEELRRRGVSVLPFKFTNQSKTDLIDHLAARIEHCSERFLLDIPQQTDELQAFEYKQIEGSGTVRMGAPKGEGNYDDCVISLALGVHGLRQPVEEGLVSSFDPMMPIVSRPSQFSIIKVW